MFRNVTCMQPNTKKCDESKKETLINFCNTDECLSGWRTEEWSDCNCKGMQKRFLENGESLLLTIAFRKVQCFNSDIPVAHYAVDKFCSQTEKPPDKKNCLPSSSCKSLLTLIC